MADATTNRECMCGNICSYFVIRCDRCREWYYISCHKLTEDAIKRLKDFYCRPCKSTEPTLQNTLKERPTDTGATYERRECDIKNHHAIHRFRGKQDPVRCICKKRCETFCIGCEQCRRWCHMECISYTKEKVDSVAKYYCPPCIERNPQLRIIGVKPKSSRVKLRRSEGCGKRAAMSPEGGEQNAAQGLSFSGATSTSTTGPSSSACRKRQKSVHKYPSRPVANDDVGSGQEEQGSENVGPINGGAASSASITALDTDRSSTTPNVTLIAARATDANGAAADAGTAKTSGTGTAGQSNKQQCICGSPCAYYVVKCDHCRAWSFGACYGLTKGTIEPLKSFYCESCMRCNRTLTNTQKQRPTGKGVTYERRFCEREGHHGIHRYQGKEEPLRCNHEEPCQHSTIECNKCKRWCHFECVNLAKEMDGKIAKYYCPPCVEENPHLLIAFGNPKSLATGSKQRHTENSKRVVASTDSSGPLAPSDNGPAKKGKDARKRKRTTESPTSEGVTTVADHAPEALENANEASVDGDYEALQIKEEEEPDTRPGALDFVLLQARVHVIEGQLREKNAELERTKADNTRLEAELAKSKADFKQLADDRTKSEDALKRNIAEKDSELADLRRQHPSTSTSSAQDAVRIQELQRQLQLRDTCIARLTLVANGLAQ